MCEEMTGDTAAAAAAVETNIRSCWLIVSPSAQCLHSNLRFNLLLPADKREREGRANGSSIASLMIADDGPLLQAMITRRRRVVTVRRQQQQK